MKSLKLFDFLPQPFLDGQELPADLIEFDFTFEIGSSGLPLIDQIP